MAGASAVAETPHALELPVESVCSGSWRVAEQKPPPSLDLSPDPQGLPQESLKGLLDNLKSLLFL